MLDLLLNMLLALAIVCVAILIVALCAGLVVMVRETLKRLSK